MKPLDTILGAISAFNGENVFNPWRDSDPMDVSDPPYYGAHYRRERLFRHFNCIPRYLLVGEAPGYQGCHFSGVPFTNEALLMDGAIPRIDPLSARITSRPKPWREPSATIVWRTLHELRIADDVVMWNAFAWHPHKPGEPMSNRAPTKDELYSGQNILQAVCDYFGGAKLIAVGRVAEKAGRLRAQVVPRREPMGARYREAYSLVRAVRPIGASWEVGLPRVPRRNGARQKRTPVVGGRDMITFATGAALGVALVLLVKAHRRIRQLEAPQRGWDDYRESSRRNSGE